MGANYFKITIYINEYIIKTEHNKFWTCTDCQGPDGNYIYNDNRKRIEFHNIPNCYNCYFHFYFQINSSSDLNYENNIVDSNYYSFTSQKNIYIHICNLEDEIELINFNTTETFYIKENVSQSTNFEEKGFKIIFDESISGIFIGLDASNEDKELNSGDIFHVTNNKGLRYRLSDKDKVKLGVHLKIKCVAYSSFVSYPKLLKNKNLFFIFA